MGFVRKITGVDAQVDAARQNAAAQNAATKQAADQAQADLMNTAKASADQQAMLAARSVATQKAADVASVPVGQAEVQLSADSGESTSAIRARKRASFGKNYSTGVSI